MSRGSPLLLALLLPTVATAADAPADPVLEGLVSAALGHRPEISQATALIDAERQRVARLGALPGLTVGLGIQNDGFTSIEIGHMETSWLTLMLTQPFYWPGKQDLRTRAASRTVTVAEARVARLRLGIEADVRRAYLELLLSRDKLGLLSKLESLWKQAGSVAAARYSAGTGPQSDLLRTELETTRLGLRRVALESAATTALHALNRLRNHALDDAIVTTLHVTDVTLPAFSEAAIGDAEARTPELVAVRVQKDQGTDAVALARLESWPDFSVSAGVMPRGSLMPMWTLGLNIGLPGFDGRRTEAVDEGRHLVEASMFGESALLDLLRLRTKERLSLLDSARTTIEVYRAKLLLQVEAVVTAALEQYAVGSVPMASVLEAIQAYVTEEAAFLDALAQAHRLAIAQGELSLAAPAPLSGGLGGGTMPGAGATETTAETASSGSTGQAPPAAATNMGGM